MYIIYGTESCGYCTQAKNLLEGSGDDYAYVDLTETTPGEQAKLMEIAGKPFRTVPQIFFKGFGNELKYIGGFTDLKEHLKGSADQQDEEVN